MIYDFVKTCLKPMGNFGDTALNEQIYLYYARKLPVLISISKKMTEYHYLLSGSILANANDKSIVWGSGFISVKDKVTKPYRIYSVRGKLSENKLRNAKIQCPTIYGDPALILPYIYNPPTEKIYDYGIIPHYVHKDLPIIKEKFNSNNILVIDILSGFQKVIDSVAKCNVILSSTLHGLILGDIYSNKSYWVKFENERKLCGDDFKFYDYFSSVDRKDDFTVINKDFSINNFNAYDYDFTFDDEKRSLLAQSCPIGYPC